jgi:hypothetical protein
MTGPGALPGLLWWLLGALVFPLWLLSGLSDYACHARTDIAHTSGTHESLLHLLQTLEIGLPLLAFLFFSVDALVLVLMVAGVLAHTVTSWKDVRYADGLRRITPLEQYVHGFLEVLPWIALALVAVLHWPVVTALFDRATDTDWTLRLRHPAFDGAILAAVLLASAVFGVAPGVLELAATLKARRAPAQASSSSARSATKPR